MGGYQNAKAQASRDQIAAQIAQRKLGEQQRETALKDALTKSQTAHLDAQTASIGAKDETSGFAGHIFDQEGVPWIVNKDGSLKRATLQGDAPTVDAPPSAIAGTNAPVASAPAGQPLPTGPDDDSPLSALDMSGETPPGALPKPVVASSAQTPQQGTTAAPVAPKPSSVRDRIRVVAQQGTSATPTTTPASSNTVPKFGPKKEPSTIPGTPEWRAAEIAKAEIAKQYGYHAPQSDSKETQKIIRLSSQFDGDPIIKNAKELAQGVAKMRAAAEDPTAAGDMSLLYGFNKILDPGSVVRESEFANAAKSGSLSQRIQGAVLRVANGERLTPEQRADFMHQAEKLAAGQQALVSETLARHSDRARRMGVKPEDVVYDPFEGTLKASAKKGGAPSPHADVDEMIRQGKTDAEIKAALKAKGAGAGKP